MNSIDAPYLSPYLRAAREHGAGFESLLWASPATQRARFEAIRSIYPPGGKSILDAGCGRADYLGYLLERATWPGSYIGIEGVEALAAAAQNKWLLNTTIIRADFVRQPARMFVGADIVVFSGSLNTIDDEQFYPTLRRAYEAAGEALVFNFLCSSDLAGRDYLFWRSRQDVVRAVREFCGNVVVKDDYLEGDCTVCLIKPSDAGDSEAVHD